MKKDSHKTTPKTTAEQVLKAVKLAPAYITMVAIMGLDKDRDPIRELSVMNVNTKNVKQSDWLAMLCAVTQQAIQEFSNGDEKKKFDMTLAMIKDLSKTIGGKMIVGHTESL